VRRKVFLGANLVVLGAEAAVVARRRGYLIGAKTVVRCLNGHLFTTLWIPGGSLKAVRLGWWRWQRCPVGKHWSLITPVNVASLSEGDRQLAAQNRDVPIP
jgi:hypothetical protein